MKVYTKKSNKELSLDQSNFMSQGGEAQVYKIGSKCYKIFHNNVPSPPEGKIKELSVLSSRKNIIVPLEILVDSKGKLLGFSMNAVNDCNPLTRFMSPKIRMRKGITQEKLVETISKFREDITFIHSNNILLVDISDNNFLMDERADNIYFIDTTTYKTTSYPATAYTRATRDIRSKDFSELTDWFSFGIVTFNMLTGVHPYRGDYSVLDGTGDPETVLEKRMEQGISVFDKRVQLPPSVIDFNTLPSGYLSWYKALFIDNKRLPAPKDPQSVLAHALPSGIIEQKSIFDYNLIQQFPSNISFVNKNIVVLSDGTVFVNGAKKQIQFSAKYGMHINNDILIIGFKDRNIYTYNVSTQVEEKLSFTCDDISVYDDRLYCLSDGNLYEASFYLTKDKNLASFNSIATVMPMSSRLLSGCLYQNVMGKSHIALFKGSKALFFVSPVELEGKTLLDAEYKDNVLVMSYKDRSRTYKKALRFDEHFEYDTIELGDDTVINFTVLDNGTVLNLNESGEFNVFGNKKGSNTIHRFKDNVINDGFLFSEGAQSEIAVKDKLYNFKRKK